MTGTVKQVYEDYMAWRTKTGSTLSFEDYLRTELGY
jgi:hypothetical protein